MSINIIPFFSVVSPKGLSNQVLRELVPEGVKILSSDCEVSNDDYNFIFIGTGGTENEVSEFLERANLKPPITLLAYDERNSLPAAMEIRAYLQNLGSSARIVHRPLAALQSLLTDWLKYARIREHLQGAKIGLIGEPSSWLIASLVDQQKVNAKWGVEIERIPIEELTKNLPTEISSEFLHEVKDFQLKASYQTVDDIEVKRAGLVTQRISEITKIHNLAAVTVQCFSLLQETEISGCLSLSYLNDVEDMVAGCEGDIPATFTMLLVKLLTGSSSFMANVASVDQELNTAIFAHCTVPRGLTENYEITNHYETGMSIGIRGQLPITDVTIVKLFGKDLSQHWVSSGTIIDNLVNEKGCRTQIRVALEEPVDYFLEDSLANHHIIVLGDHVQKFVEFFEFLRD